MSTAPIPRFRPFPPVSCRYGVPLWRSSERLVGRPASVLCVAGPAGEYDCGGAYCGLGGRLGPVWAVWQRGRGREGVQYIRALSAAGARQAVAQQC